MIFGLLFGTVTYIAHTKGLNITVHHIHESKMMPIDMNEAVKAMDKADPTTDNIYDDMSSVLDSLEEILGGGTSGKENR